MPCDVLRFGEGVGQLRGVVVAGGVDLTFERVERALRTSLVFFLLHAPQLLAQQAHGLVTAVQTAGEAALGPQARRFEPAWIQRLGRRRAREGRAEKTERRRPRGQLIGGRLGRPAAMGHRRAQASRGLDVPRRGCPAAQLHRRGGRRDDSPQVSKVRADDGR